MAMLVHPEMLDQEAQQAKMETLVPKVMLETQVAKEAKVFQVKKVQLEAADHQAHQVLQDQPAKLLVTPDHKDQLARPVKMDHQVLKVMRVQLVNPVYQAKMLPTALALNESSLRKTGKRLLPVINQKIFISL